MTCLDLAALVNFELKAATGPIKGILIKKKQTRRIWNKKVSVSSEGRGSNGLVAGDIVQVVAGIHVFTVDDFTDVINKQLEKEASSCSVVVVRSGNSGTTRFFFCRKSAVVLQGKSFLKLSLSTTTRELKTKKIQLTEKGRKPKSPHLLG